MESFFLLCFRSCLRGDDNKEYYTILGFENPSQANPESIKKAYKKMSLSLHPDKLAQKGIEATADHKLEFLKAKEAYDVLSDPKRKKYYDELGATGLRILEHPTETNPTDLLKNFQRNRGDRLSVFLLILILFASIVILPILFSLKCDNKIPNAPWVAIWTPMWLFDLLSLVVCIFVFTMKTEKKPKKTENSNNVQGEDGDATQEEQEEKESEEAMEIPLANKIFDLLTTISFIVLQVFVLMRLDHYTHWSWFAVFAPWYANDILKIIEETMTIFSTPVKPECDSSVDLESDIPTEASMSYLAELTEYYQKVAIQHNKYIEVVIYVLRIWQSLFLAARLDHYVHWNWALVFLPIWVFIAFSIIISYYLSHCARVSMSGIDEASVMNGSDSRPESLARVHQARIYQSLSSGYFTAQFAYILASILLVCRLEVRFISTFLIIIAFFIVTGCCFCTVSCGLLCLSCVDPDTLIDSQMTPEQYQGAQETYEPNGKGEMNASTDNVETGSIQIVTTSMEVEQTSNKKESQVVQVESLQVQVVSGETPKPGEDMADID